jgi:hypothetical protein
LPSPVGGLASQNLLWRCEIVKAPFPLIGREIAPNFRCIVRTRTRSKPASDPCLAIEQRMLAPRCTLCRRNAPLQRWLRYCQVFANPPPVIFEVSERSNICGRFRIAAPELCVGFSGRFTPQQADERVRSGVRRQLLGPSQRILAIAVDPHGTAQPPIAPSNVLNMNVADHQILIIRVRKIHCFAALLADIDRSDPCVTVQIFDRNFPFRCIDDPAKTVRHLGEEILESGHVRSRARWQSFGPIYPSRLGRVRGNHYLNRCVQPPKRSSNKHFSRDRAKFRFGVQHCREHYDDFGVTTTVVCCRARFNPRPKFVGHPKRKAVGLLKCFHGMKYLILFDVAQRINLTSTVNRCQNESPN